MDEMNALPPWAMIEKSGIDVEAILFCTPRFWRAMLSFTGMDATMLDVKNPMAIAPSERMITRYGFFLKPVKTAYMRGSTMRTTASVDAASIAA